MAFKPITNQRYYIIAKHSQLPIGVANDTKGQRLVQKKFDPEDKHQQFRIDSGGHFFWLLLPPFKERYVAVNDSSMEDRAELLQWEWEKPKHNLRFIPEYVGDGYYRIKAMHSNKYLDVYEMKKDVGAAVVQHMRSTTDNQLFKLVPVVDNAVGDNPQSYAQVNDLFRKGALGLIGLVPKYGGGLQFLVGMFWSEHDHLADLWNQMKQYVDDRIREFLKAAELENLKSFLEGEVRLLYDMSVVDKEYKGDQILSIIQSIREKESYFLNRSKEVLPYLMGMGTIIITLRKMIVTDHAKLFKDPLPAHEIAGHRRLLKETIKSYTDSIEKSRKELMTWRMSHIPDAETKTMMHSEGEYSTARDTYNNWALEWSYFYESDKGDKNHRDHAKNAVKQRRNQVQAQYASELEDLLKPARQWQMLDPDAPRPLPQLTKKDVGSFGGPYSHNAFSAPADDIITCINLYFHGNDVLSGIEVVYSGGSSGLKGFAGPKVQQLRIDSKEYITNVYGYTRNFVEAVWFTTNKGRTIGGGNTNKTAHFSGDLADGVEARLTGISGSFNGGWVEHLTFHWTYVDQG